MARVEYVSNNGERDVTEKKKTRNSVDLQYSKGGRKYQWQQQQQKKYEH